jgi:hypothetical protein
VLTYHSLPLIFHLNIFLWECHKKSLLIVWVIFSCYYSAKLFLFVEKFSKALIIYGISKTWKLSQFWRRANPFSEQCLSNFTSPGDFANYSTESTNSINYSILRFLFVLMNSWRGYNNLSTRQGIIEWILKSLCFPFWIRIPFRLFPTSAFVSDCMRAAYMQIFCNFYTVNFERLRA